MIVSTDALVLRSMKYGESSRIVTLLTRAYGKVSVIAKGARGPRSRSGAALDPLSVSHVVFYRKAQRDLQTLSQADLLTRFNTMLADADRLLMGFAVLEYLNAAIHGEEEHGELYDTAISALTSLDSGDATPDRTLLHFLCALSRALGFALDTAQCVGCDRVFDGGGYGPGLPFTGSMAFDSQRGGFLCADCARIGRGRTVPADVCRAIRDADRQDPRNTGPVGGTPGNDDDAAGLRPYDMAAPSPAAAQVRESATGGPSAPGASSGTSDAACGPALRILHAHLASHLGGLRDIRSLDLLERTRQQAHESMP